MQLFQQTLIIADQHQYITSVYRYTMEIALRLAQMVFLQYTRNYFAYLGLQTAAILMQNLLLSRRADRLYPYINKLRPKRLDAETKNEIVRNTKAMITHRIGGIVVFGTDNLLISSFVGVVAVGLYSNYLLVTNGLTSVYSQFFRSLTASVGNLGATADAGRAAPVFWKVNFAGGWLYGFSAVCLVVLFNPFISLWVGKEYLFSQAIVILIALNFYVSGMRQSVLTFRDAYGLYWYDRYKPIAESVINLAVSILLAIPFGVAGILAGTFVSTMTTCFWIAAGIVSVWNTRARKALFPGVCFKYRGHIADSRTGLVHLRGAAWDRCAVVCGKNGGLCGSGESGIPAHLSPPGGVSLLCRTSIRLFAARLVTPSSICQRLFRCAAIKSSAKPSFLLPRDMV